MARCCATPTGYGTVAKGLHWLTVLALVCQFTIGYLLDDEDGSVEVAAGDGARAPGTAAAGTTTSSTTCSTGDGRC